MTSECRPPTNDAAFDHVPPSAVAPAPPGRTTAGRKRSAGRFLLFILLYVFFLFAFGLAVTLALNLAASQRLSQDMMAVLVAVLAGFPAVALTTGLMLLRENKTSRYVGLGREAGWGRHMVVGFGVGLGMIVTLILLEWVSGHLRIRFSGVSFATGAGQLLSFLFIFLVGSTHEEMLFRGYPFQRLMEVLGTPATVLLLAAAFGAIHSGNPHAGLVGTANTAIVGVLFALAYLSSGRLWFPIGLHWGWNFAEAAFGLPVSGITIERMPFLAEVGGSELFHGGTYGPESSLLASGVFLAAISVMLFRMRRSAASAAWRQAL